MVRRVHFLTAAAAFAAWPRLSPASELASRPQFEYAKEVLLPRDRPLEWEMDVLDGPRFRLSDYRGKAVFLNIFATWCSPCIEEQPSVVAFAAAHPSDTAVIGVNVDEDDDAIRRYRKRFSITYPIAVDRRSRFVPNIFSGAQLRFPTTIVVGPDLYLADASIDVRSREWFEAQRRAVLEISGRVNEAPSQ